MTDNIKYVCDAIDISIDSKLVLEYKGVEYKIYIPMNNDHFLTLDIDFVGVQEQMENRWKNFVTDYVYSDSKDKIKSQLDLYLRGYDKIGFEIYLLKDLLKGIDEEMVKYFLPNIDKYTSLKKKYTECLAFYRRLLWAKGFCDRLKELFEEVPPTNQINNEIEKKTFEFDVEILQNYIIPINIDKFVAFEKELIAFAWFDENGMWKGNKKLLASLVLLLMEAKIFKPKNELKNRITKKMLGDFFGTRYKCSFDKSLFNRVEEKTQTLRKELIGDNYKYSLFR